jgi:hypothetical protein
MPQGDLFSLDEPANFRLSSDLTTRRETPNEKRPPRGRARRYHKDRPATSAEPIGKGYPPTLE